MKSTQRAASANRPSALDWIFRILGFIALVALAFALPRFPALELDSSWRQALGVFYYEHLQFGRDVVFTYGPLGFVMGNTYWGAHLGALIVWQLVLAVLFASVVYLHAWQVRGYARVFFLLFFYLFGLAYTDAAQQSMIALAGWALLRDGEQPRRWHLLGWLSLLTLLALVKFTNLLLAGFLVGVAGAYGALKSRSWKPLLLPGVFFLLFLAGWKLCGQHLANLPAYVRGSWAISQGYLDAMGVAPSSRQLYFALAVAGLTLGGLAFTVRTATDRLRAYALTAGALGYLYLNWKHGFIRADGHQIGFYYAVLTVLVTLPLLFPAPCRWLRLRSSLYLLTGVLCLFGMETALPALVRGSLAYAQNTILGHAAFALNPSATRERYHQKFLAAQYAATLPRIKTAVGDRTVDVLGYEQAVALFNGFNYTPRPVLQGYSAYTPYLAQLNRDFLAGAHAPDFLLFKLQTLDRRLGAMDDSLALQVLATRYRYQFTELGYTLWQRDPGPYDPAAFAPVPLRSGTYRFGETIPLGNLAARDLWVRIDYHFNLLGKARRFLYRPVEVLLHIIDTKGHESVHRLPAPVARTGFRLNPAVDDLLEFMRAHGGHPARRVASIRLDTAPQERDCVQAEFQLSLATLPASDSAQAFFQEADRAKFPFFDLPPVAFNAQLPPSVGRIDNRDVTVMHAPSEMTFDVPRGTTMVQGNFGFIAGAYADGGQTNGATFSIVWTNGTERIVLHERHLDPVHRLNDRGLQHFSVALPRGDGQVLMQVAPGPFGNYAFDWTAWSGIKFK